MNHINRQLNINFDAVKADSEEIFDSFRDFFVITIVVETALGDGFQWVDLLQGVQVQDEIQELIQDVPDFLEGVKTAASKQPSIVREAVGEAYVAALKEMNTEPGKNLRGVATIFYNLAESYEVGINAFRLLNNQYDIWARFINYGDSPLDELLAA